VDLENVLDQYYEEDPGKAAHDRTVLVGIRTTFKKTRLLNEEQATSLHGHGLFCEQFNQ